MEELIVHDPRFVGLARYLPNIHIMWSYQIPTACAGHGFIFFNPDFWDRIPEQTRYTVLVHECWHLILRHLERGKDCDPYMHNIAADHVINLTLESDGFTFEGTNPYKDKQYLRKSTEQVYNIIYSKKPEDRPKPDPDHTGSEQIEDLIEDALEGQGEGKTLEEQKEKAEDDVKKHGEQAGTKTGNQGIQLDLTRTKVLIEGATYHDIFSPYLIDPLSGGKRTYMRPNRRQHGMKTTLRLPGRSQRRGKKNRLTHLIYALDVSGSISPQQAQQFHDSVHNIKVLLNPTKLTVLFFDTQIVLERTFNASEPYAKIRVQAGGGTNLQPVFRRVKEIDPEALVIFTDLCVGIPPKPEWECIWIVPDKRNRIPAGIYGDVYLIPDKQGK